MYKTFAILFLTSTMAQAMDITVTVDDSIAKEVIYDYCATYSWSATLADGSPNPQDCFTFTEQGLANYLINGAIKWEIDEFTRQTMATANQQIGTQAALIQKNLTITVKGNPPPNAKVAP